MSDAVIAILSAFFVIGILVGITAVIAAAVFRSDRRGDRGGPGDPMNYEPRGPGEPPPGLPWDDTTPDGQPRWPGEADNDISGR